MALQQSNSPPLCCLITDRQRVRAGSAADGRTELIALVRAAACAGVDLIQIRERDLEARDLYDLVRACLQTVRGTSTRILVNDRTDVALAAGAHGVHLRSDSPSAARIRPIVPAGFLVGRSVHNGQEAAGATEQGGLDYLIAGTVFPTASKAAPHKCLGFEGLRAIVEQVPLPVLAIGGVTTVTAASIAATGAAGFAAIGLFCDCGPNEDKIRAVLHAIRPLFDRSRSVP